MKKYLTLFGLISVLIGGIFLPFNVSGEEVIDQESFSIQNVVSNTNDNSMLEDTSAENNTIILNVAEINGTERWVNGIGEINPTMEISSGKEYLVQIANPTTEEHELKIKFKKKIKYKSDKVAESGEIPPGKIGEFTFETKKSRDLKYFCDDHPKTMKGTIKVSTQ